MDLQKIREARLKWFENYKKKKRKESEANLNNNAFQETNQSQKIKKTKHEVAQPQIEVIDILSNSEEEDDSSHNKYSKHIIDISDDDSIEIKQSNLKSNIETRNGLKIDTKIESLYSSPIQIFKSAIVPHPYSVHISDLFPDTIKETYIFSMQIDMHFLFSSVARKDLDKCPKIFLICDDIFHYDQFVSMYNNEVQRLQFKIDKNSLHHSKMVINFHIINGKQFLEVIVMTCNLTATEYNFMGQCFWKSPLLSYCENPSDSKFSTDLSEYLQCYYNNTLDLLSKRIKKFTFEDVKASFIYSVPTKHNRYKKNLGFHMLNSTLDEFKLKRSKDSKKKLYFLCHFSSLAGSYKYSPIANILTHILTPMAAGCKFPIDPGIESFELMAKQHNFEPMILFPTKEDIKNSEGNGISSSYIFNWIKPDSEHFQLIKNIFFKRNIKLEMKYHDSGYKNKFLNNHSKVYIASDDCTEKKTDGDFSINFNSLTWVMIGSFNLSKSAWGWNTIRNGWCARNFECGIITSPEHYKKARLMKNHNFKFVPVWALDNSPKKTAETSEIIPIKLPFILPVTHCDFEELYSLQF